MSSVDCFHLSKLFTQRKKKILALNNVSLEVEEGEIIIITGPPSSGKTTLLSVLGGRLNPDEGESYLLGQNIHRMTEREKSRFRNKNIGYVFDEPNLIQSLTVEENVMLPLQFVSIPHKVALVQTSEMLEQVGMIEQKRLYPSELSKGECQLVAIARALITDPKLLLLDEPTSHLDHQSGIKIFTLLRQLALDLGVTIISVINDIRLHPFAHRVVKMKMGKIEEILGESAFNESEPPFLRI